MIDRRGNSARATVSKGLRRTVPFIAALLVVVAVACESLLDVRDPDIVTPDDLGGAGGLATLRAGAIGDLALALAGNAAGHGATPGLILYSGIFSDEMVYSGTFPTRREYDVRALQEENVSHSQIYHNLHRARVAAKTAGDEIQESSPNLSSDPMFGEMRSLEGMTYVYFGEHFCNGVPFSEALESGELVFGSPVTNEAMFETAVALFDEAIANPGGSSDIANLAAVGKGRALLNLGRFGEAASAVAGVPTNWVYNIEHSSATLVQQNGIYVLTTVRRQFSVADGDGTNGLPFRSANDPRVPWEDTGTKGQDDQTPYYNQLKYPSESAPVALASGIEARLIEAEAALQAGDIPTFEDTHNTLRATVGLPPVDAQSMTQTEREDFHFSERAFWLWGTGHRTGDLRRLVRQYGRNPESVFPTGAYFKGGSYGPDVNWIVPIEERNNPNFNGCLDRNA
jgi:hypothetical protein